MFVTVLMGKSNCLFRDTRPQFYRTVVIVFRHNYSRLRKSQNAHLSLFRIVFFLSTFCEANLPQCRDSYQEIYNNFEQHISPHLYQQRNNFSVISC